MKRIPFIASLTIALLMAMATQLQAQQPILEERFTFHPASEIQHDSIRFKSFEIISGEWLVFAFESNNAQEDGNHSTAPSGFYFQVPAALDSFQLKDGEILNSAGVYLQPCRCADRGFQYVENGKITGVKQADGTWLIASDCYVLGATTGKRYDLKFEAIFQNANP